MEEKNAKEILGKEAKLIDKSGELEKLGKVGGEEIEIPVLREEDKSMLADVSSNEFMNAQRNCKTLSELWKKGEQHLKCLEEVLRRLEKAKLTIKPSKCKFAQDHVKFLGQEIGSGKRSPGECKIHTVKDFPTPKIKTHIRSFLGTVGYYSRYIKDYARVAVPLTGALKGENKKERIEWTSECEAANLKANWGPIEWPN